MTAAAVGCGDPTAVARGEAAFDGALSSCGSGPAAVPFERRGARQYGWFCQ